MVHFSDASGRWRTLLHILSMWIFDMSHYKFEDARVRRVHARRGKKGRERSSGTREKKKTEKERETEQEAGASRWHSLDNSPEREKESEGRETAVAGERKREKDLSHECCVWSSFMVVRLNSRSKEGEFRKWRRRGVRWTLAGECWAWPTFVVWYGISRDRGRVAKTALLG